MRIIRDILLNNIAIKSISLILALLTWSYISGQVYKETAAKNKEAPSIIKVSGEKLVVKTLPIYVNIEGTPAKGYRVVLDKIAISPSNSVVAGAPEVINELSYISTMVVNVEGRTATLKGKIELTPIPNCRIGYEGLVRVTIPIARERRR
ncbi:MAG: hypothetical protein HQ572_04015 [Candidatus Omnitrophica bacterium]|nr:hypothetical protein [Candidatus Omnitrophota bacterium]